MACRPFHFLLFMCCVAALFEPIARAVVDEKYSRVLLFPTCLPSATAVAMHLGGGCRSSPGAPGYSVERTTNNCSGSFIGGCELRLQLSWTCNPPERCKARHRLEIGNGVPTAPGKHCFCQSCRPIHCTCQAACTKLDCEL